MTYITAYSSKKMHCPVTFKLIGIHYVIRFKISIFNFVGICRLVCLDDWLCDLTHSRRRSFKNPLGVDETWLDQDGVKFCSEISGYMRSATALLRTTVIDVPLMKIAALNTAWDMLRNMLSCTAVFLRRWKQSCTRFLAESGYRPCLLSFRYCA